MVFKHDPLGKECNVGVRFDLHPLSCGAAYAAEAARRQGKFWEYYDALFASTEELEDDVLEKLARDMGLNPNQFEADRVDGATKAKVEADVALGKKLDLVGTPTAFLNNRMISGSGMSMLERLIEQASGHSHD